MRVHRPAPGRMFEDLGVLPVGRLEGLGIGFRVQGPAPGRMVLVAVVKAFLLLSSLCLFLCSLACFAHLPLPLNCLFCHAQLF